MFPSEERVDKRLARVDPATPPPAPRILLLVVAGERDEYIAGVQVGVHQIVHEDHFEECARRRQRDVPARRLVDRRQRRRRFVAAGGSASEQWVEVLSTLNEGALFDWLPPACVLDGILDCLEFSSAVSPAA